MTARKPSVAGWARSVALTALALAIVACSHHHDNTSTTTTTTNNTTTSNFADSFGAGFGTDYGMNNNTQPANVSSSDVNPVSNTTQPTSLANAGN